MTTTKRNAAARMADAEPLLIDTPPASLTVFAYIDARNSGLVRPGTVTRVAWPCPRPTAYAMV
jgi:hypothetical protein